MEQNTPQTELFSRGFTTEVAAEFTLPDYQPEIKRLLRVRAIPQPVEQYVGGSAAELTGAVEFQILYAAEDGSPWCVVRREDYHLTCPLDPDGVSGTPILDVETLVEAPSGRVSAPRKLSARCRVRTQVRALAEREPALSPAETGDDLECLPGQMTVCRQLLGRSAPFTVTDEIALDPDRPPLRVVSASGEVFPTEVQAGTDLVACRGEIAVTLLSLPDQPPMPEENADGCLPASVDLSEIVRRVPFAVEVPLDGVDEACAACAWGSCSEINVTVEEDRILCDVTAVLSVRAVRCGEVPFIKDAYPLTNTGEPVFETLPARLLLACKNTNCTVSATKPLAGLGIRPEAKVVEVSAEVSAQQPAPSHGTCLLPGTVRFRVLTRSGDGEYSTAEFEQPFRLETTADSTDLPAMDRSILTPVLVSAAVDGDLLRASAEISAALALFADKELSAVKQLRAGDPVPAPDAACVICYPAAGDTLWSVAKRYRVPVASLQKKNDLPASTPADSPDSLNGVHFLVV